MGLIERVVAHLIETKVSIDIQGSNRALIGVKAPFDRTSDQFRSYKGGGGGGGGKLWELISTV